MKSSSFLLLVQCTHILKTPWLTCCLLSQSLKKSYSSVCWQETGSQQDCSTKHLDFMMQAIWSRQPAFRLMKKKRILLASPVGRLHGTPAFFGPMKTGSQLAVPERKNLSYKYSFLKVFLLAEGYREIKQLWVPWWGVQQERESSGCAAP